MDVAHLLENYGRRIGALAASGAVAASLAVVGVVTTAVPAGAADTVVYERDQTIPVPPASTYSGSGGGDGWNIVLSDTQVFNVFHHSSNVTVACHQQSDAAECYPARTLIDANNHHFGASGHSSAYYDAGTQHVYLFTVRDDNTGGVVCFDATTAATEPNPFCGFTPLTAVGHAVGGGTPYVGQAVKVGDRWFAYSWVNGMGAVDDQNALLCFDFSSHAACAGQPFSPSLGGATVTVGNFPPPPTAAVAGRVIVGFDGSTNDQLTCFDTSTNATCAGSWPTAAPAGYIGGQGTPFALLNGSGDAVGFCLPTGTDPCFGFDGASTPTPAGMPAAIPSTSGWNGSAVTIGTRVYVPNGNNNEVDCYNAATDATCGGFPKHFNNLSLLYTVNPDPARPSCLWVNADNGQQINNFDAFSGGGCGQGALRVLGSSFVAPHDKCVPGSYVTLRVLNPARSAYTDGSVKFLDGDANQLPIPDKAIDARGAVDLTGLNLNSSAGLPQFLVTLNGIQPSSVTLRLTWKGERDPDCVLAGTVVSENTGGAGRCHQLQATIRGTDAAETIIGTPGDDVIVGFGGNDVIRGRGGKDVICGRSGKDRVIGGVGDDIYLSGGAGDDKVSGGQGDDHVFGRDDRDLVRGGEGNDEIHGNAANDVTLGGKGNDSVDGGYGNDQVVGNAGTNVLRGGPGKDVCTPVNAKNKAINC
jgi:Ca2+-binding RTX toxin-like protein